MYEDFYEPSEFDIMVDEFKAELRASVKREILDEMEKLKYQLVELKDIKDNWDKKVAELNAEKRKAEIAVRNAEADARRKTLKELLEPLNKQMWGIYQEWAYAREKCDRCDADGYIHYKSPQGKDCKEECNCRKKVATYRPVEAEVCEIKGRSSRPGVRIVFKFHHTNLSYDWDDEYKRCNTEDIYDGRPFDEIKSYYWMIFDDKDKAQEYCDYLNSKPKKERNSF